VRNVIVTGGSRGLGLGIARSLASAGYAVVAIARSESAELELAIEEAERGARGSLAFRCFDLADTAGIRPFVRDLRRSYGSLYGLVNNAGIGSSGLLATMRDQEIELLVRLNTVSPILFTKYVVRSMLADRSGRIVNIASVVGITGYRGLSVYSATKASLLGFTRSLARELGPAGINVNAIAPGFVDTDMTRELAVEERAQLVRRSALRRLIDVEDVASAVAFLLGDGSRNVTGTVITVDAGSTT